MYIVYWTMPSYTGIGVTAFCEEFGSEDLGEALKFSEVLRKRKYAGESIFCITIAGENPNCVGKQGVDVTGPDYNWKKRRI